MSSDDCFESIDVQPTNPGADDGGQVPTVAPKGTATSSGENAIGCARALPAWIPSAAATMHASARYAAARGIDVQAVDWVLHYGLPTSAPAYVHRAGRTGRAGRSGSSVSFVTEHELPTLQRFAKELKIVCSAYPRRRA